ncbi:hypothetical protein CHS0354_019407 [Potamilus streckersoni]|uniref:Uncharacterized protein n=1 Tax=Potamilus streckersoni TaxID=2493646 RepID=A0AAE0VVY9_9BIVA|nr:hypothetical protein CHS0354_019407 [Potamilus streckersoni]
MTQNLVYTDIKESGMLEKDMEKGNEASPLAVNESVVAARLRNFRFGFLGTSFPTPSHRCHT